MWLEHNVFGDLVKDWWNSFNISGRQDFIFAKKLKLLKCKLKAWNKTSFGHLENRKSFILNRIMDLDREAESSPPSDDLQISKANYQTELEEIIKLEEISWRQKSRCLWLKQGDNNTRFFHKMANAHRRFNQIDKLEINGNITDDKNEIANGILSFYESLYKENEEWRPSWTYADAPRISEEESDWLQRPFQEEEILLVIKDCDSDKALGPDGFSLGFYKHCWSTIKDDFMCAINHFHTSEYFERSLNATYIALIPKKSSAMELKDYRPISLIGSFYKIIAKALADRLKVVLHKLVDTSQMAFLSDRNITDAALIANECLDSRLKSGVPGIICILDIEKAFDHVNWRFLLDLLRQMGFSQKWINWISFCISSVKFSVLINGTPHGFFSTQRGLRQGDPLSPFLFILAMEGLSKMLYNSVQENWITGFFANPRRSEGLCVSHILYADDTFIFCEAKEQQLLFLRLILTIFEAVSGLLINFAKSSIFPVNSVPNIQELAGILQCNIGSLPTKYLGLPLGEKHKSIAIWNEVLEKMEKKLSNWKRQCLSLGGRVTLINSVLDTLPTYSMSLFPAPTSVLKRMDKLRREFLWNGNRQSKSFCLVNWKNVTMDKKYGGLGIKNLKCQNESLLSKWHWRFNKEENALWRRLLVEKYSLDGPWHTKVSQASHGFGVWKHIQSLWSKFESHITLLVGSGRKIRFWEDAWIGHTPLKDRFQNIHCISSLHDAPIADFFTAQGWNLFPRRNLNDWEIETSCSLLQSLSSTVLDPHKGDSIKWNYNSSGAFSVKSCYKLFTACNSTSWPWRKIWYHKAPLKVSCFSWLVAKEACLTQTNLQRRGMQLCSRCPLCEESPEDIPHLFLHCKASYQIWSLFFAILGLSWTMPHSILEFLRTWGKGGLNKKACKLWNTIPMVIWWTIWLERNNRIFEGKHSNILSLKNRCISLLAFWCNLTLTDDVHSLLDLIEALHNL